MSSTEQLLIGPEVDQVHQCLATLRTYEAGGMPQVAMVTCTLSVNCWSLFGNLTLATSAALGDREERQGKINNSFCQVLCQRDCSQYFQQ